MTSDTVKPVTATFQSKQHQMGLGFPVSSQSSPAFSLYLLVKSKFKCERAFGEVLIVILLRLPSALTKAGQRHHHSEQIVNKTLKKEKLKKSVSKLQGGGRELI